MDVQLRKGILELCVLAALREKDSYGYQIIRDISQVVEISESTLYPILRRMELGGSGGVLSDSLQQPSAQIPSSHPAGTANPCGFCPGERAADCHTGLYYRRKHR